MAHRVQLTKNVPQVFMRFPVGTYLLNVGGSDHDFGSLYLVTNGDDDPNVNTGYRCINVATGKRLKPSWYNRMLFLPAVGPITLIPE